MFLQEPSTFGLGISQRTFPPEQRNNYPPPRADEGDHASLSLQTLNQVSNCIFLAEIFLELDSFKRVPTCRYCHLN